MHVATMLTRSQSPLARAFNLWLVLVLVISFTSFASAELATPDAVSALPALSVSASLNKPLLGGTSQLTINVTNTGTTKGYNLSVETTISSSLLDPDGTVEVTGGSPDPTSVSFDPATGDTRITIIDVTDLAPSESQSVTIDLSILNDASWEVTDLLLAAVEAYVNDVPDNSGTKISGTDTAQAEVIPIDLVTKTANQSTEIDQATGTGTRPYSYTLQIQNNYKNPSASVVVTDTLPDGLEFLGQTSGPPLDFPATHDPVTGDIDLSWTLGTLAPGAAVTITYDVGVRYDYYGTANGGNNRPHDVWDGRETTSTVIPDDTTFSNTAWMDSEYKGSLPTTITPNDSDSASVIGVYATLNKTGTPSVGGYGTIVDYTITYQTSEYYNVDNLVLVDTIGDGLSYVPGSASVVPDSITYNPDGTTVLTWLPSTLGTISPSADASLTLQASIDTTWQAPPLTDEPIRAGDTMENTAKLSADWHDQVNPPRSGHDDLVAEVPAGVFTGLPGIEKHVWDPDLGIWTDTLDAQAGDDLLYRVRFNTTDGATPERSDITLGYITVTDWLPEGTSYNDDAVPNYSDLADFSDTTTPTARSVNPTLPVDVTIGGLSGIEWFLGDVAADGWWETTFTVTVQDSPVVRDGLKTGNHWKLTVINSFGDEYSDRDIADLNYTEPDLTIDKAAAAPSPLVPSSVVTYTVTIDNDGTGDAGDILMTDTTSPYMRDTTPTVTSVTLDGSPLTEDVDYKVDWNSSAGTFTVDFYDTAAPAVDTTLSPGGQIVIVYEATVDGDVGAYRLLSNTADVTWNSRNDGSGRDYGPVSDPASVRLSRPSLSKVTDPGPIRVGDSIPMTITVTVPAGAVLYWPEIRDRVTRDGIYYVPGSTVISDVSGTPVESARSDTTTPDPIRIAGVADRTTFRWLLANTIDNRGQATDYVFQMAFELQYTAEESGVQEMNPPTGSDLVRNDWIRIYWGYDNPPTRDTDTNRYNGSNHNTAVDQPILTLSKNVGFGGPYSGSQPATYTQVITNTGYNTAYDLDWEDILDTYMGSPTLVSATHSTAGDILGSITPDFSSPPTLTIDFGAVTLDPAETITLLYTIVIDPNVPASANQTNTADVDWSSMPGTPAGSRLWDDQPWEESWHTADTDSETIPVAAPIIGKMVIVPPEFTFGSLMTTVMTITVPAETVLPSTTIMDMIAIDGVMVPAAPFTITNVSGNPQMPATPSGPGIPVIDTSPSPGTNVAFPLLADIDNADPAPGVGDTPYVFTLTYTSIYTGLADSGSWEAQPPQTDIPVDDTAVLGWTVAGTPISVSATAAVNADQPVLALDKTVITPGPYFGGKPIVYSSLITNIGDSTAYRMTWEDLLPVEMSTATFGGATHSLLGDISGSITTDFSSPSTATIDFNAIVLPPGQSITVTYTVGIDPGAGSGSLQVNIADVDWTSQAVPTGGERIYNDSAQETWTGDTDVAFIQIEPPVLTKTVESGVTTRTIGEGFFFLVDVSIPTSETGYHVEISDTVPDGLSVEGVSIISGPGAVAVGSKDLVTGETPIVWTVGNVANPPIASLTMQVDVSVDETFTSDGSLVSGLPVQDSFENSATIKWDDALVGGTTRTRDASATVTAVEPDLTIDKVSSKPSLEAAESTTYTVTLQNTGTSTAFNVDWADVIAPELFSAGVSPSLFSVSLDGTPLTSPADYTADFGTSTTSTVDLNVPIPAGSTAQITYTAQMNGGIVSGTSMPNTSTVTYTSLSTTTYARFYGPVIDTEDITARGPNLSISKTTTGDTHIQAGEETEFTIAVTNTGDGIAHSVVVTDTLPADFYYVGGSTSASWSGGGSSSADPGGIEPTFLWDFADTAYLDPGDTLMLTFRAQADNTAASATYVNTAESDATDGADVLIPSVEDSSTVDVTHPEVAIDKHLAAGQDPFVQVGQTVTYEFLITNSGDTVLMTIPLTDDFDPTYLAFDSSTPSIDSTAVGSIGWSDVTGAGTLSVGATMSVTATFTAVGHPPTSSSDDVATIASAVDVWGDTPATVTDTETVGITAPSITLNKALATGQAATVSRGELVVFDIGMTNSGDTTLVVVPLTDTFDSTELEFVSAVPSIDSTAVGSVSWTDATGIGQIFPGATTTVTVTFRALIESLPTTNSVGTSGATDANSDVTAPDSDDANVTIVEPDLTISKAVLGPTLGPGEWTAYWVTMTNTGTGPAHDVAFSDRIPDELDTRILSGITRNGSPMTPAVDYVADFTSPTTVTVDFLTPWAPGDVIVLSYTAELEGGHPAGLSLVNVASAEWSSLSGNVPGEGLYGPISDSTTITTLAPALALTKNVVGDTEVQHGQDVAFSLTLTNVGNHVARSLIVTDTLPPQHTYVPFSALLTFSNTTTAAVEPLISGSSVMWNLGPLVSLLPSEWVRIDFLANVGPAAPTGITLNTAIGGAEDNAGGTVPPAADLDSYLVTLPNQSVTKQLAAGQDPFVQVGEAVSFDIFVTNSGTTTITAMPLLDTYDPTYLSFTGATPSTDFTGVGMLGWSDLTGPGGLAPGDTTTVTVDFTAIAHPATSSSTDTATVIGATDMYGDPVPDADDIARIGITDPTVTITKQRAVGQAAVVSRGEMVDFDIGITNSGDTTLTTVPLSDTYDPAILSFQSATPSNDSTGVGSIGWTDALGVTDLPPGVTTTVTVTFQALVEATVTTNTASTTGGTDINNDPTPASSDDATLTVVEPNLTILKTVDNPSLGPGEETTYTVTFDNIGTGPAHDVAFTDRVPDEFYNPGVSPTLVAVLIDSVPLAPLDYVADFSSAATATVNLLVPVPAGSTLAIVYNVILEGGHPAGLTLTNDAQTTYSSLSGVVPGEGEYGPISDSVNVVTRAPELAITKTSIGDNEIQEGQAADYRVQIANIGDAPAYSVVVTDTLPPDMSYVPGSTEATWSGPTNSTADPSGTTSLVWDFSGAAYISAGETLTLEYSVSADTSPTLGTKTNTAEGGADDGGGVPVASVTDTETILVTDPSAAIDKHTISGQDPFIQVGQSVSFEIVVTNDGSTIIDLLPFEDVFDATYLQFVSATPSPDSTSTGTLGWSDLTGAGTLAVGASTTITVDFTAIAHPATSSTTDTVTVIGAIDQYNDPVPDVSDTAVIGITEPSVSVVKDLASGQSSTLQIGDTVDYTLAVTNSGDTTLTVMPLTDTYDSTVFSYVTATPAPSSTSTGTLTWTDITTTFGDFAPGQTETLTVQFDTIAETASGVNTATAETATDINNDPAPGNSSATTITVFAPNSLEFSKSADPAAGTIMLPGDVITYSITLFNNSPAPVPDVTFVDEVPNQSTYVAESMVLLRGGASDPLTDAADGDEGTYDSATGPQGTTTFSLGDVSAGESVTVTFQVTVRDEEHSREGVRNYATLQSEGQDLETAGPVDHPVDPFDIIKTGEDINGGKLESGDEILWTITVTNTGLVPTSNTIVRDTVPPTTTFVSGSMTGPGADQSGAPNLVWNVGDIPVGGSVTCTFRSAVNAGLPSGTEIRNQASVEADQSLPKYSDFPDTPEIGDETLLTTGGPDWLWVLLGMLALLGGLIAIFEGRRTRRRRSRVEQRRQLRAEFRRA